MTSSLVGSEMCIRDSAMTVLQNAVSVMRRTLKKPLGQLSIQELRQAVSYTHLTLPTICSV
eukprot:5057417-Prorocentrum_lima.AAC.1